MQLYSRFQLRTRISKTTYFSKHKSLFTSDFNLDDFLIQKYKKRQEKRNILSQRTCQKNASFFLFEKEEGKDEVLSRRGGGILTPFKTILHI